MKYILLITSILVGQIAFTQSAPELNIGTSYDEVVEAMKATGQDYGATKIEDVNHYTFYITEQVDGKSVKVSYIVSDGMLEMILRSYPAEKTSTDKSGVKSLSKTYVDELESKFGAAQHMELRNITVWRWKLDTMGYTVIVDHDKKNVMRTQSDHAFSDDVLLMMDNYEDKQSNTPIEYKEFSPAKVKPGMSYCELVANYGEPDESFVVQNAAIMVYGDYMVALESAGVITEVAEYIKEK